MTTELPFVASPQPAGNVGFDISLAQRNAELAKLGITPIWFEKERYEFVESILRLAKNELRHRGGGSSVSCG